MAAKDIFYDAVRRALEKEGWLITNDPLFLRFGGLDMYIDLGAEKDLAAERNQEKIAIDANELISRGIPKKDIVLAFHSPFKRQFTEFAVG
ncbi:MAG: element excision factor XisH family protein [Nostoc sp.]|uniref:element excision factor XisH family protein n=1 Tax=Nostoc sp. TaxID=1180 RepID=UPI002FF6FBEB